MTDTTYLVPSGFLTLAQVAAHLGVSRPKLLRLVKAGKLTPHRDTLDQRVRLFPVADVEALAQGELMPEPTEGATGKVAA